MYNEDRVALLGENGVGKSTFLKALVAERPPDDENLRFGPTATIGYFSQDNTIESDASALLDVVLPSFRNENEARSALGRYRLGGHVRHTLDELSGGQRARVQLLLLERIRPNILLLDEPTDNLDLESILVIEEALVDLDATLLAITHDATFTRVFNRFLLFDRDGVVAEAQTREKALELASKRDLSLLDESGILILSL